MNGTQHGELPRQPQSAVQGGCVHLCERDVMRLGGNSWRGRQGTHAHQKRPELARGGRKPREGNWRWPATTRNNAQRLANHSGQMRLPSLYKRQDLYVCQKLLWLSYRLHAGGRRWREGRNNQQARSGEIGQRKIWTMT